MELLLDTHIFPWMMSRPQLLSEPVQESLADPSNFLFISAISAFEISNKVRLGKWPEVSHLPSVWAPRLNEYGITQLDLTGEDLLLAGSIAWDHRDPFDRIIAAQALMRGLTLVSVDQVFSGLPGLQLLERA